MLLQIPLLFILHLSALKQAHSELQRPFDHLEHSRVSSNANVNDGIYSENSSHSLYPPRDFKDDTKTKSAECVHWF